MNDPQCLQGLVHRIRVGLKRCKKCTMQQHEWECAKVNDLEPEERTIARIARAAKCDWELDLETGKARFFPLKLF